MFYHFINELYIPQELILKDPKKGAKGYSQLKGFFFNLLKNRAATLSLPLAIRIFMRGTKLIYD